MLSVLNCSSKLAWLGWAWASPTLVGTWYGGSCAKNCDEKWDYSTLQQFCTVVHVQTNTINLQILPYNCWVQLFVSWWITNLIYWCFIFGMVVRVMESNELSLLMLHVWYGGSCTNKHDKLIDTSKKVLSNTIIFECSLPTFHIWLVQSFISRWITNWVYWCSIFWLVGSFVLWTEMSWVYWRFIFHWPCENRKSEGKREDSNDGVNSNHRERSEKQNNY